MHTSAENFYVITGNKDEMSNSWLQSSYFDIFFKLKFAIIKYQKRHVILYMWTLTFIKVIYKCELAKSVKNKISLYLYKTVTKQSLP